METQFNYNSMSAKKTSEDPAKMFTQYVNAVWLDFDNMKEMDVIKKIARSLKPKQGKKKK